MLPLFLDFLIIFIWCLFHTVSRIRDVYLESKVSSSSKAERPRLNLGIKQGHVGGKATYALAKVK